MPLDVIQGGKPTNPFDKFNTPESKILFPVGERKIGWQKRDGSYMETPAHKAIIRLNEKGDNAILLDVVGRRYKLIHNRELFTAVEDAILSVVPYDQIEDVQVKDKVSGWGKVCFREYVFPSIRRRLVNTVGDIGFRIIVQNGYGGSALRIHAGAIDFFCTNGMVRGEYMATYRRHTSQVVGGNLVPTVNAALAEYTIALDEWDQWSKKPVKHEKAMALFKAIASSEKIYDGLSDQFLRERETRGNNLWAVYSTLTYYASHPEGMFTLRKSVEEADSLASTMLRHELDVVKWTATPEWKEMELT